ncbi:hypothetical protein IMG5_160820 [Ichthyophthirius multifiliis]|uniref:Tetratricopeptide repeat protein n=1 Tax=Ichthyophthirius multifiliis TaxID=5932 RepID=G0QZZ3_ICHMU|nr:hypothetical protein IMG5_160820 [Ichthyophthirius multifiliis]EGR29203.1 hypothetical protein IMG5_160820 [Ichthyophthirius multifiliis]|eukprot:XP_004030439.1 hypothetical protein IMG5_160820 [Ichthyophthirius multifiliis]
MDPNSIYKNNFQNPQQQQTPKDQQFQYFPNIVSLKNQGSKKFSEEDYDGASKYYLQAILEIEESKLNNQQGLKQQELQQLEIMCRNNYCTVKAKQQDFHSVIIHASSILGIEPENLKANFRLGQAHFNLGKFEKALPFLTKAKNASPEDKSKQLFFLYIVKDTWSACYEKCQKKENNQQQEKKEEKNFQENTKKKKTFNKKKNKNKIFKQKKNIYKKKIEKIQIMKQKKKQNQEIFKKKQKNYNKKNK